MALAECIFVTWTVIILVALIPKALSEIDMVFLYFVDTIFVMSIFTVLDLNLGYLTVSTSFEKALGVMVYRIIAIPLVLIISANFLRYEARKLVRFGALLTIELILILFEQAFRGMHMIRFVQWNLFGSALLFIFFIIFSNCMAWLIVKAGREGVSNV